jgi:hypothetical protein
MDQQTILAILSVVAAWAVQWGWMKAQINQMGKRLDEHNDVKERLARIEEKLNYIIKTA